MNEFLKELFDYARENKKYWLVPLILTLVIIGFLIVFTSGSAVAPFIYTIF